MNPEKQKAMRRNPFHMLHGINQHQSKQGFHTRTAAFLDLVTDNGYADKAQNKHRLILCNRAKFHH